MSMATQCKFFGHIISVEKALAVRKSAPPRERAALVFECLNCGMPVRPRSAVDRCAAHFVHLNRNPQCQFVDPSRDY